MVIGSVPVRFVQYLVWTVINLFSEIREISALAVQPTLTQYDHFGRRIDRLTTSEGWRRLLAIFQEEGIVAIPHERPFGSLSRLYAFAKCVLAAGDAQVVR